MKNLSKQVGRIKISKQIIFENTDIQVCKLIFSNFYPYHVTIDHYNTLIYTGFCVFFDEIEEGSLIPFYDCIICLPEDGEQSITFEKLQMTWPQ